MKTAYRFVIAALAAAAALSSCTKDIAADRQDTDLQDGVRTIAISFDTPTKTVLGGPYGLTPQFEEGDLVMVSDRKGHEVCTVHVMNKEAFFTTTLDGKELKAAYPAEYAKLDDGGENIVDVLVPTNQTGRFADANIAMTDEFTGNKAMFRNKAAILRFYVDKSIGVKTVEVIVVGSELIVGDEAPDVQYISDGWFENGEWRKVDTISLPVSDPRMNPEKVIRDNRTGVAVSVNNPMADSTLADLTDDPDGRICYVAVRPVTSCDLRFAGITSTQEAQGMKTHISSNKDMDAKKSKEEKVKELDEGPFLYAVDRIISGASISAGKMADVFLPYYIKINVGTEQEPVYQYWGYCNVGAFLPEEAGLYFSWGNVDGHWLNGTPDSYPFTSEAYINTPGRSLTDDIRPFGPNDAVAAAAAWNGARISHSEVPFGWRMPTKAEFEALKSYKSEWKSSLKGRTFGSYPNSIFLPATGFCNYYTVSIDQSNVGQYWSSAIVKDYAENAYYFSFDETNNYIRVATESRYGGRVIRPIYEPESQGLDFYELEEGGNLF